jgi:ATP phosphoribosyltransferase
MVIALPKGRIGEEVLGLFRQLYGEEFRFEGRRLILEQGGFKFLNVRNWDVAVYVEQGSADIGIVGLDVLEELQSQVFRVLDLGLGRCRVSVAGLPGGEVKAGDKIATKLPNITRRHFEQKGVPVEIIKLNGSIELAPLVGLSDFIVDIVETGATLRENGLAELEPIMESTAHLIVNRYSFWLKRREILELSDRLAQLVGA